MDLITVGGRPLRRGLIGSAVVNADGVQFDNELDSPSTPHMASNTLSNTEKEEERNLRHCRRGMTAVMAD